MPTTFDESDLKKISQAEEQWFKHRYESEKERLDRFETLSGLNVEPLYSPAHIPDFDYSEDLGLPGEAPYVRGVYPTMYRGQTWTLRQLAGYGPAEETNQRYKFLLKEGATGINGVFDYPTLRGYDSIEPEARADAGRGGVAIDTLEDMEQLYDGIPIDRISCSLVTCQPICNISVQSMFFANAQNRGIALNLLQGTSQNDFLMETAITIAPEVLAPHASFKLSCDAIEYCTKYVPRWNPISFAGYNYREAGCNAAQEVALVIANAIACTEELIRRGIEVDRFAPRLSFFLSGHSDFFEEIAKYRAARRVWHRVMTQRFNPANPKSSAFRFHVQTAGVALTAQQPLNNIARAAYHGLSAVLGGAQSIHIDGYDEALCTPTELSAITALRTNQILQLETRVTHTIDPLGGSYFVESMTNGMEEKIVELLDTIDKQGGIVKAVESGWVHTEIANSAYEFQKSVEKGDIPIVGVNCFRMEEEECPLDLFEVPETIQLQEKKLKRIQNQRSGEDVRKALDAISRCCEEDGNLMEVIVDSVKTMATEGEISKTIKASFGTWTPPLF